MTADCVNYALVPLKPERFAFLEYAVSAFIPKISQVDAKNALEACEKQLEHVDESDKRSLSFKEFIEVVRVRSLGKKCGKKLNERERLRLEKAVEDETETSFEEEDEIETDSELAGDYGSNKTRKTNANSTPGSEKKRTLETKKDFAKIVANEESKEETITTTADEGEAVDADMEDVVPVQKPSRRGRR